MHNETCDILVVGAGIFGAAAAYYLKLRTPACDVLLLDRAGVAQGNTSKSVAMVRDSFTSAPSFMLAHASIHQYRDIHALQPGGIDLNNMKYLWLFTQPQYAKNQAAFAQLETRGVDVRRLTASELAGAAPCLQLAPSDPESQAYRLPAIHAGLLCGNAYSVDPIALTQGYVTRLKELGGRTWLGEEAEVVYFLRRPLDPLQYDGEEIPEQPFPFQPQRVAGVALRGGGQVLAGTTVLATGAWSRQLTDLLGRGSLLSPKKRQWFYLESDSLAPLHDLPLFENEDGTLPFTILPQGIYIKPSREGGCYVALSDDLGRPFNLDTTPDRRYFANCIQPFLKGYFPAFENAAIKAMGGGSYCYEEVYRMPVVDWLHDGLMLVSGCSGSGIMKGDAIGRVAAHRYALGRAGGDNGEQPLDLPGGVRIDTEALTIRGRGRIEPERLVI